MPRVPGTQVETNLEIHIQGVHPYGWLLGSVSRQRNHVKQVIGMVDERSGCVNWVKYMES